MATPVEAVFIREVHPSAFFYIESDRSKNKGGSSQHYIEAPPSELDNVVEFLGGNLAPGKLKSINVGVIGDPHVTAPMTWRRKSDGQGERTYTPQNRQVSDSPRHPAWTSSYGFPEAEDGISSTKQAKAEMPEKLRIVLVKLADGRYFAGHASGDYPSSWPNDPRLRRIWKNDGVAFFDSAGTDTPDAATEAVIQRIFAAWEARRSVLLYGPPGTGKTHVLSSLRQRLQGGEGAQRLLIELEDASSPFRVEKGAPPIPMPATLEWLTFHQSFTYEEFFLGLRPHPASGGTELRPRAGRLLDRLYAIESDEDQAKSAVFFIDEINRGNAARIFGELISFLDADYRADGSMPLPVPLPGVDFDPKDPGQTKPIDRPDGSSMQLPVPWEMPQHLYVVASMNSVDRATTPLDSALARRFERIELRPDLKVLADWLGIAWADVKTIADKVRSPEASPTVWEEIDPEICAILLLDRLNHRIAEDLGEDFELGHALLRPVVAADKEGRWAALTRVWDESIWPQLAERYLARPEQLREVLKVGDAPGGLDYAFRPRTELGAQAESLERIAPVRLSELSPKKARSALQFLAR